ISVAAWNLLNGPWWGEAPHWRATKRNSDFALGACERGTRMPHALRQQNRTEGYSSERARTHLVANHSQARGESLRHLRTESRSASREPRKALAGYAAATLESVRLHDLRHSFASVAASGGQSLVVIGKMLGHSKPGDNVSLRSPRRRSGESGERRRGQAHCCSNGRPQKRID